MRGNLPAHVDPKHPVILQRYAVFTPPIHELAKKLGDWIDQRQPGGYIYGPARFGKSKGVKWHVRSILEDRFGKAIPLHMWSRPYGIRVTEPDFWQSIGVAFGVRYQHSRATRGERREQLKEFLIWSADRAGSNHVVMIVDEAHDMTYQEWKYLMSLQNALDMAEYRLSVFAIASHQMGHTYELLARADEAPVAARFMVAHWPFPGLRSADEIEYALNGYDMDSEWPPASGISYLGHFAPKAFSQGERLAHAKDTVWRVLKASLPTHYKGDESFPMQHVALATEKLLFKAANGEAWESVVSEQSWLDAIAQTQFTDHMRLVSAGMSRRSGHRDQSTAS